MMLLPLCVYVYAWSLFCGVIRGALSSLALIFMRKRVPVALLYIVLELAVFCIIPYGAVVWSAVCDCGISWPC